jgi:hypothetical protein
MDERWFMLSVSLSLDRSRRFLFPISLLRILSYPTYGFSPVFFVLVSFSHSLRTSLWALPSGYAYFTLLTTTGQPLFRSSGFLEPG